MFKPISKNNSIFKGEVQKASSFGVLITKTEFWTYGNLGQKDITFGQDKYTFGGSFIPVEDVYKDRGNITTNWK